MPGQARKRIEVQVHGTTERVELVPFIANPGSPAAQLLLPKRPPSAAALADAWIDELARGFMKRGAL